MSPARPAPYLSIATLGTGDSHVWQCAKLSEDLRKLHALSPCIMARTLAGTATPKMGRYQGHMELQK